MKALRGTPEADPRVAPTPSLEVTFELRSHLRVHISEARVEQGLHCVYCATEINI